LVVELDVVLVALARYQLVLLFFKVVQVVEQ
jgi:hypothetical protein